MKNTSYKILIIDDHRLFADGLSLVLSQLEEFSVSTFYNARPVLEDDNLLKTYDLALVDLNMPNLDGFSFLQALKARNLAIKVIVVSAVENRANVSRLIELGAKGFLPKSSPSSVMLDAIKIVLNGGMYTPNKFSDVLDRSNSASKSGKGEVTRGKQTITNNFEQIRPRQLEVLRLIRDGHSNKGIAQILNVSESTIKSHITIIFQALGAKNRTACVRKGVDSGLIDAD